MNIKTESKINEFTEMIYKGDNVICVTHIPSGIKAVFDNDMSVLNRVLEEIRIRRTSLVPRKDYPTLVFSKSRSGVSFSSLATVVYSAYYNLPLDEIRKYHIRHIESGEIEDCRKCNLYSTGDTVMETPAHYQANIHRALKYAVKTERIKDNPAANIDLPKKQKHIADFYSPEELKVLLEAAKGTDIEMVVYIAAWLGLRRGEIIGLKWNYVDFENQTISVKGTMARAEKTIYKETAKNASSLHTLPMNTELAKYLYDLKERQIANRKRLGKHYTDKWKDFVCVRDNGEILKLDYVTRHIPLLCEQCGLRKIGLHELRHSNVSLLLSAGVSIKEIQEWAGHSTYTTTADIYAHIQSQNKVKLSQSIERLLTE